MSVCEDRHPGVDDWLRQHSLLYIVLIEVSSSHPLRNVCAGHRRLILPMFTTCYVLLSFNVVKHCCIFLCFIFSGRPGLSSLSLTTNSFHSLGLQFSTTLVCEDGCRASVIGFTLAHYINKTSKGRFFSYYFVH